ncbi:hypothetical protein ABZ922_06495 [Streptomyces shenzhenensis]|uniref:hypothetical protein n=1 Tax=Streptomyces shenzhenensis TaxID=943815 RepID=UPI0033EA3C7E
MSGRVCRGLVVPCETRDQHGYTNLLALVFTDWAQLPATPDALQAAGWTWRGTIPWHEPISRPVRNGFRRECEYVLWGTRGEPYRHAPTVHLPGLLTGSQPRGQTRQHITGLCGKGAGAVPA